MFLGSFERKIPELFKIDPIYISSSPLKAQKSTQESLNDNFTYFFGCHGEASEWPLNTLAAYFIKWTTSGEPLVAPRSHWHTYFWRNKQ